MVTKEIIYYTDNRIDDHMANLVRENILKANLPIVSVSLKPIDFGRNLTFYTEAPGYITMIKQISTALSVSDADYVFFCEHDVLYHPSHFDFTPPRDDIFYYNKNVWRWLLGSEKLIRYDRMLPLSCLCVERELALEHYEILENNIYEAGQDKFTTKEPALARKWGYEPGTKKIKRGGITDYDFDTWASQGPNIDIRHRGTFSPPKVTLDSFRHAPTNWQEIAIDEVPEWDLKHLFNI